MSRRLPDGAILKEVYLPSLVNQLPTGGNWGLDGEVLLAMQQLSLQVCHI